MEPEVLTISDELKAHLQLNASTESYRHLPGEFCKRDGVWGCWIDWDKVKEHHIADAKINLELLKQKIVEYDKRTGPRVGDYLELPYGMKTRFTHAWDEGIQIGGGSSSFYLGKGYISYSGGLDPSIEYKYLQDTGTKEDGMVWFFNKDWSGGGRGVNFYMPFRVFKLTPKYDPSTIWMLRDKERALYREKAETITRINGNGQQYTLPVPEILLQGVTEQQVVEIEQKSGLKFEQWSGCWRCQPLKITELLAVTSYPYFEGTFYDNWNYKNTFFLKWKKEGPSRIPSIS